jgi:hypothetical protein
MVQTKFVEIIKTHVSCPITYFFTKILPFEIMWENMAESGRPHMAI